MNLVGVEPVVLADERCCGHDQLWNGDVDTFRALAERNIEQIKASGAKTVVTSCAECARALKLDYREFLGATGFEVVHITEFLAERLADVESELQERELTVTYQDPCRLGRQLGVFDAPRQILGKLPGLRLNEMARSGRDAICCGTSCWSQCGSVSKQNQLARLESASRTGAEVLVTACPKCKIHFRCTQSESEGKPALQVLDVATVVAGFLGKETDQKRSSRQPEEIHA
jgi:Fe-S oxidoreductase